MEQGEYGVDLAQSLHSPGLLAGTADPVLLLLVKATALADVALVVQDLTLGVEEGEGWAAVEAEVLLELLVLAEPGALLGQIFFFLIISLCLHPRPSVNQDPFPSLSYSHLILITLQVMTAVKDSCG